MTGESCAIELLLAAPAAIDPVALVETLRKIEPSAALGVAPSPAIDVVFHAHRSRFADGDVAAQALVTPGELGALDAYEDAESQTWNWEGAADAVAGACGRLRIEERFSSGLERAARLKLLHATVRAVLEHAPVAAIHWEPAQRLVDPAFYVSSLEHGTRLMDAAVNVRVFKVSDGRGGEYVMDTRGLTAFGLPDLQVHFHTLAVPRVAELLFAYAEYTFDKGDVLGDDSIVRGVTGTDEWECRRAKSLVPPLRDVVDIVAGEYAIGH